MASRISAVSWLGLGVMALFACALLLGGIQGLWFAFQHQQASATVLRYEASQRTLTERKLLHARSGGATDYVDTRNVPVLNPVVRFDVDGRSIEITNHGTSMNQPYAIGSTVQVHYLRGNPEGAVLADNDWGAGGGVIQLLTGALVASMLYGVYRLLQGQPPAFLRHWRTLPNLPQPPQT
ncbi:hypothetical protein C7S18_00720 [Ahniella affigens]|uniref:DUF3592 domain-containing protein n=1 Tax=Ahniella affigens TaxID=2021234 RepID=A0A2P1PLU0_9GAMM|nr:DUF3592 domain-containing protein [Ahniella affigens]AVP95810.1 hypothetical protein C7S18_00720 [Ahniella affigens]